jgi:hypothetical protein
MSFTSDTKLELSKIVPDKKCCQLAEIAGFLRFSASFPVSGGKLGIRVVLDSPASARLFYSLIKSYFGSKSASSIGEPKAITKEKTYNVTISSDMNATQILREVGILTVKEGYNVFDDWISPSVIKKRCDKKAVLRGIFLSSGTIADPSRTYYFGVSCPNIERAKELVKLINSFGLKAKIADRNSRYIVYIKDREQISDLLNILGASGQYFKFQNVMITKDLKNRANRGMNCNAANLDKSVNAAQKLISDIKLIEEKRGLDILPERLYITAQKRMEFPELGLSELAKEIDPDLSKSGLNHRLRKISEIAAKL